MVLLPHKNSRETFHSYQGETLSERTLDALRDTGRHVLRIVNLPGQIHTASLSFEGRHALNPSDLSQMTPFELGLDVQRIPLHRHEPRHSAEDPQLIPVSSLPPAEPHSSHWEDIIENPDYLFTHPDPLLSPKMQKK